MNQVANERDLVRDGQQSLQFAIVWHDHQDAIKQVKENDDQEVDEAGPHIEGQVHWTKAIQLENAV